MAAEKNCGLKEMGLMSKSVSINWALINKYKHIFKQQFRSLNVRSQILIVLSEIALNGLSIGKQKALITKLTRTPSVATLSSAVSNVDKLTDLLGSTCTNILNSVAPLKLKQTKSPSQPWLNENTRTETSVQVWRENEERIDCKFHWIFSKTA